MLMKRYFIFHVVLKICIGYTPKPKPKDICCLDPRGPRDKTIKTSEIKYLCVYESSKLCTVVNVVR